jgi:hypothetical protein
MTTPHAIYMEATRRGLRLERAGDKLAVIPKGKCPPDFADILRQHKGELLDWLEAQAAGITLDCAPWLHVAKQVLAGEFDGLLDNSVRGSLEIGLRSIAHPVCRRALARLNRARVNLPRT